MQHNTYGVFENSIFNLLLPFVLLCLLLSSMLLELHPISVNVFILILILLIQNCKMIMTSVSGHLLDLEFAGNFRSWYIPFFILHL